MKRRTTMRAKRTVVSAIAVLCLTTQLTACIETAIVGAVAASAIVLSDRRSVAVYSKDAWIDVQAATPLNEIGPTTTTHIIANAFNSRVLLTGEVASEADKQKAADVVKAISGVKGVDNQLIVGPITSLEVRNNDSFITSKVKSRLIGDHPELGNAMKVVTENGVVFVLGMLTQSELERGIEIARTTSGVKRVVKTSLITIIQEPQAKALDQEAKDDAAKTQGTVTPLSEGSPPQTAPVTQPTTQGVN
jgi:osmotically-inducible protein OsmY